MANFAINSENEAQELKVDDHVHFLGFLENAANYLKAFDIFLLPSIKEGLPYVLLEAAQADIAVVASNVGGIPDIVEDNKSGLLFVPCKRHTRSRRSTRTAFIRQNPA